MLTIKENYSLKSLNTFGINAICEYFIEVANVTELLEVLNNERFINKKKLILGGGSNMLFIEDFDGLVVKIDFLGIETIKETEDYIYLKAGAGEVWHDFVLHTVANNLGGIENLSLIPGSVGASPLQNIGAYGVEIKDTFHQLEALNIASKEIHIFNNEDCKFGYRESIFKHEAKDHYVILNVTFKLSKKPVFKTEYGAIKDVLVKNGIKELSVKTISDAVIEIRESKLPNPKIIGNAGSFFKNPEIDKFHFDELKIVYPNMPSYPINDEKVKVPAGWLIEQAGWKGFRDGEIGVHANQALVLVNYGNGSGKQLKALSEKIQKSILEKFGIKLSAEVNFIGG
jgi:UDP-N-acetylmuramate dehydrogenase